MLTPENSAIALIDYQPAMYRGVRPGDARTAKKVSLTNTIRRVTSPFRGKAS
jgi:hypothetical protein